MLTPLTQYDPTIYPTRCVVTPGNVEYSLHHYLVNVCKERGLNKGEEFEFNNMTLSLLEEDGDKIVLREIGEKSDNHIIFRTIAGDHSFFVSTTQDMALYMVLRFGPSLS